jgi:hypothetical protein
VIVLKAVARADGERALCVKLDAAGVYFEIGPRVEEAARVDWGGSDLGA